MVGILLSYWGGLFSGAILVSGRVTIPSFTKCNPPNRLKQITSGRATIHELVLLVDQNLTKNSGRELEGELLRGKLWEGKKRHDTGGFLFFSKKKTKILPGKFGLKNILPFRSYCSAVIFFRDLFVGKSFRRKDWQ